MPRNVLTARSVNCDETSGTSEKTKSKASPRSISQLNDIKDYYEELDRGLFSSTYVCGNDDDNKENVLPQIVLSNDEIETECDEKNTVSRHVATIKEEEESFFMSSIGALADAVRDVLCRSDNDITSYSVENKDFEEYQRCNEPTFRHRISTSPKAQYGRLEFLMKCNEINSLTVYPKICRSKSFNDLNKIRDGVNEKVTTTNRQYRTKPRKQAHSTEDDDDSELDWFMTCGNDYCSDTFEIVLNDISSVIPTRQDESASGLPSLVEIQELSYDSDLDHLVRRHRKNDFSSDERIRSNFIIEQPAIDLLDDETLLQEIKSQKISLIWHLDEKQRKSENRSLINSLVWIEFGSRLRDAIIQPRLMWTSLELSVHSQHHPFGVDLLDICRILDCNDDAVYLDKNCFPFARKKNCFLIETTQGSSLLFETHSNRLRQCQVRGLKLLVAEIA